jgi:hypothetical protein
MENPEAFVTRGEHAQWRDNITGYFSTEIDLQIRRSEKRQLDATQTMISASEERIKTELRAEITASEGRIKTELRAEIAELRTEVKELHSIVVSDHKMMQLMMENINKLNTAVSEIQDILRKK